MHKIIGIVITLIFLAGCSGGLKAVSMDQSEQIAFNYNDGFGTREVNAISSSGERFVGTLIWIKDLGSSGRYRGSVIGDKGRTLSVELECNTFTTKCVGTAKASTGQMFSIY